MCSTTSSKWMASYECLTGRTSKTNRTEKRVENVIFRPRHEGEILLVWLVNKVEDKKEQQNRKSFHFACLTTVNESRNVPVCGEISN